MRNDNNVLGLVVLVCLLAFSAAFVLADPTAPTALNVQGSETRDLSNLADQTISAQGGNVTEVNIDALTITTSWQGYYGDVSGEITLDDGSENTFYNWTVTSVDGEIFATRTNTVTWDEVICGNATHIANEETYLGQSTSDGDSVTNTFNRRSHPQFGVATRTLTANTCNSTNAFVNNASQTSDWLQILLAQNGSTTDDIIYATIMNATTTGFDGATHDFQLLVGENEKTGSLGSTTYYFWVELE